MSGPFLACIAEAHDAGEIDPEAAGVARDAYQETYDAHADTLGPDAADRLGAKAALDGLERARIEAARQRRLAIRSRRRLLEGVAGLKGRRGYEGVASLGDGAGKPPKGGWVQGGRPPERGPGSGGAQAARALELIVENKPGLSGGPFPSIEGRYRAIRGRYDAMMAGLIEKFEAGVDANLLHQRGRAMLRSVVREAFGEDTGDLSARALARAWSETAELARTNFNAAGGSIDKLDGWGLPQMHDSLAVRSAGREAWMEAITPLLDRTRMIDRVTGAPLTERRLAYVLGEVFDTISSNGANKRAPGEGLGRGRLAATRAEHRFLVFRDAESWTAYQSRFGEADPFSAMMGHLDEMARDTARMQILGPNPDHQFDWLKRFAQREAQLEEAGGKARAADRAKSYALTAQSMYDHFVGTANTPVNTRLASWGASGRAYLSGVTLGASVLSDLPSAPVFGVIARTMSGLDRFGEVSEMFRQILSPESRGYARRSGFVIEQATDGLRAATQDNLRLLTVGAKVEGGLNAFARRVPAAVLRAQGQTGFTAMRKRTFRLEFLGMLADSRAKSLADLATGDAQDRTFGQLLTARGFTEADWTAIRGAPTWEPRPGATFLRPTEISAHAGDELGLRVAEMIDIETRLNVPETSLWTRAKLLGGDRPGTWKGELNRSWAMFRSFTLTASHLYMEEVGLRAWRRFPDSQLGRQAYFTLWASSVALAMTLAGGASMMLHDVARGRDPRDPSDPEFWGAALLQGGGVGIFGDFFYAAQARNGKTAPLAAWGPGGQFASDVWNATGGQAAPITHGLRQGESLGEAMNDAHTGRSAATLLARYTPISSLWWARAAWQHAVVDQLQRLVDPDADEAFRQRAARMEHSGQSAWWEDGDALPDRAPELTHTH